MTNLHPNWGTAIVLSTVIGAFCFLSDADYRDEFGRADELQAVQKEEATKERIDRADRAVCGPGAIAQREEGVLSCFPKRGRAYEVARSTP